MTAQVKKICPDCGTKNPKDAAFCEQCGHTFLEARSARRIYGLEPRSKPPKRVWLANLGFETVHESHWPGLYAEQPGTGRFHTGALLRLFYSPDKAMKSLYASARFRITIPLLLVTGVTNWSIGAVAEENTLNEKLGTLAGGMFSYILFFVILAAIATAIAKWLYGGRGDLKTTMSLLIYCSVPLTVLITVMYVVFALLPVGELLKALVMLALLTVAGLWLYVVYSYAIAAANDILPAAGEVISIPGAIVTSLIIDGISLAIHPIGLHVAATLIPLGFL